MVRVLKVPGDQDGLSSLFFDQVLNFTGIFILAQIRDEDVRALSGVSDRDCPPDSTITAGDHCLHALQPARALVADLAVIRTGVHLGRRPWHWLLLAGIWRLRMIDRHDGLLRFPASMTDVLQRSNLKLPPVNSTCTYPTQNHCERWPKTAPTHRNTTAGQWLVPITFPWSLTATTGAPHESRRFCC